MTIQQQQQDKAFYHESTITKLISVIFDKGFYQQWFRV